MTDCLLTEVDSFSTFPQLCVATTRWKSFKIIHGEVENIRRFCFYFKMMICCWQWMCVLQRNWWTGREQKEKFFLVCDDDLLLQTDVRPSNKLMDRCRREREIVSTLRWWSVAADGSPSFKDIYGQVENGRRNCLYFPMMICCRWWISVLQGHLGTCREPKEKLFLLCDDDPLLQTDVSPSRTFRDRSRTERENVSTLRWWSVPENTWFYLLIKIVSC